MYMFWKKQIEEKFSEII